MIFLIDRCKEWSLDIRDFQAKITEYIELLRKGLDDGECFPNAQTETLDIIAFYQSQLQYLTEMQKVPFDVVLIIEKEATSEITEIIDDFSDDLSAWAPTQE